MLKMIQAMDLHAGDILLYRSTNPVARAIQWFDRSDESHAGLYLGNGQVGEALMLGNAGVNRNPLTTSVLNTEWVVARRLISPDALDPVLGAAGRYLDQGNRYAYGQIVLLAGILLTRRVDLSRPAYRMVADRAFRLATRIVDGFRIEGREPMICSEFVFRAYDEADQADDDPYSIAIETPDGGQHAKRFTLSRRRAAFAAQATLPPTVEPGSLYTDLVKQPHLLEVEHVRAAGATDEAQLHAELDAAIREALGELQDSPRTGAPMALTQDDEAPDHDGLEASARDFARAWADATSDGDGPRSFCGTEPPPRSGRIVALERTVADFVTPGDLARSPSLRDVGRLLI